METSKKQPLGTWVYTHQSIRGIEIETRFQVHQYNTIEEVENYSLPHYQRHNLGILGLYHETIQEILADLSDGINMSIIAGSDGSFRESEDQVALLLQGAGPTDGYPMSSYRPE
jgi:hypothetical protein